MCNEDLSKLAMLAQLEKELRALSAENFEKLKAFVEKLSNDERQRAV